MTYFAYSIFIHTFSLWNNFFKSTTILFYTDIVSLFHSHFVHDALESSTFYPIQNRNVRWILKNGINSNQFLWYGCLDTFPRVLLFCIEFEIQSNRSFGVQLLRTWYAFIQFVIYSLLHTVCIILKYSGGIFLLAYTECAPIVTTDINCIWIICFFFGFFDSWNEYLDRNSNQNTYL